MAILEVRGLVKNYSGHLALDGASMEVPERSIFGLLGPNGAGKTTMIRVINQITGPDKGEVYFNGRLLKPGDSMLVGYLPEERGLYKKMKVGEQALYLAQLKGMSKNDAIKKLKYWFQKYEIEQWWNKKIEELSKGMAQKVQFIITILHNPPLLILDEPFSGFDPINANLLKAEILNLKNAGTTIIFSTHNMSSVEELCDHITLINQGKSILSGNVQEVRNNFSENIVQIEVSGNIESIMRLINEKASLLESKPLNGSVSALVKMPANMRVNDLLTLVMPYCQVHGCKEVLPGMDEIFINVVNQTRKRSEI